MLTPGIFLSTFVRMGSLIPSGTTQNNYTNKSLLIASCPLFPLSGYFQTRHSRSYQTSNAAFLGACAVRGKSGVCLVNGIDGEFK